MRWRGRRVLVTGAGGFIGSHLTEHLLKQGASVRALVHYNSRGVWGHLESFADNRPSQLEVVAGDIRDRTFVHHLMDRREFVFHLAALIAIPYSYMAPDSFVETNVAGTLNILEAARREKVKGLVHTSTSEVYGTAQYVPIDEKHPLQGQSPYSATKIAADKLVESYFRSFDLPLVTVRPFNTFGPRQSARAVIPTILTSLLRGHRQIRLGDLRPVRDFTFVQDTVRGFRMAAEALPIGEVINIGAGVGHTVRQTLQIASKLFEVPVPLVISEKQRIRPEKSEVWRLICDNRKAARLLGWRPRVSFDEGLKETAEYLRSHLNQYKVNAYNI